MCSLPFKSTDCPYEMDDIQACSTLPFNIRKYGCYLCSTGTCYRAIW